MLSLFRHPRQRGQAMTETIITASTVLVPIFLLIPLLGKYIDMKQTAIQAARYEAWEYTVWYGTNAVQTFTNPSGERPFGYSASGQPVKTRTEMQTESRKRFFSDYIRNDSVNNLQINQNDFSNGYDGNFANTLWVDHRGQPLWDGSISGTPPTTSGPTPDVTGGIFNTVLDIIDAIFGAVAEIASHLTNSGTGFTIINMDGRAVSGVQINVFPETGLIDWATFADTGGIGGTDDSVNIPQLSFFSGAAVLSDTWNAGGLEHTTNQAGGLVPTKLLGDLLEPVQPVVDTLATFLAPELRGCNPWIQLPEFLDPTITPGKSDGSLWLGYMNIDAVHPDRLEEGGGHDCPDGICVLDPEPSRSVCDT